MAATEPRRGRKAMLGAAPLPSTMPSPSLLARQSRQPPFPNRARRRHRYVPMWGKEKRTKEHKRMRGEERAGDTNMWASHADSIN
uniref:Uncharacterized protein n=1 Tax=Oryza rufipogon TaxID=4529 RepID=A0A0E0PNB8_ORYRU